MERQLKTTFNFDYWRTLAEEHPEQFEELRKSLINQTIDTAPKRLQRRLEGLQFQIEARRQVSHSPLGLAVTLSQLMLDNFYNELQPSLKELRILVQRGPHSPLSSSNQKSAQIIPLTSQSRE